MSTDLVSHTSQIKEASIAAATSWFSSDILPLGQGSNNNRNPKITVVFKLSADSVVQFEVILAGSTSVTASLKEGAVHIADCWYWYSMPIPHDAEGFNIEHVTGTQTVTCWVSEVDNNDL